MKSSRLPMIAAMIAESDEQNIIRDQLGAVAAPRFCQTLDSIDHLVETGLVRAVLTDLRDSQGRTILPLLKQLRSRTPTLPVVICFRPSVVGLQDMRQALETVPNVSILLLGFEHVGLALKRVMGGPTPASAAETLLQRIVPLAPAALQPFFTVCSIKSSPKLRVPAAAAWSQTPRRTLERRLTDANLPGAATVVGSCTALHAAWWLDVQQWPTKQVIQEMKFSHPSALTRNLQRYFGCSVLQLRQRGGFNVFLMQFEQMLRRAQS